MRRCISSTVSMACLPFSLRFGVRKKENQLSGVPLSRFRDSLPSRHRRSRTTAAPGFIASKLARTWGPVQRTASGRLAVASVLGCQRAPPLRQRRLRVESVHEVINYGLALRLESQTEFLDQHIPQS